MYFSAKELTDLIVEALEERNLDERSIHQLIYFLHFPTPEVPNTIAEVLCSDGDLLQNQNRLGKRLAWGHIEDLSGVRDIEVRANRQLRVSRQLNRIVIYMTMHQAPSTIGDEFSSLLDRFVHMLHFFDARRQNINLAYAAEEVLLLEKILESLISSSELAEKFLRLLFERLKPHQAKTIALSLGRRLEKCGEMVSNDKDSSLILPSSAPPLKESLRSQEDFLSNIEKLQRILTSYSGPMSQLH
jgi:hypothetical protein